MNTKMWCCLCFLGWFWGSVSAQVLPVPRPFPPQTETENSAVEPAELQEPGAEEARQADPSMQASDETVSAPSGTAPVVDYDIQMRLEPQSKMVYGTVRLIYTNHSPDIISDLHFHTYLNAFKNNLSTYALEAGYTNGWSDARRGYTHVRKAVVDDVDLTGQMHYFQGPDSAPGDQTVLRIPLQGPLMPGQSATVVLDFEAKLPKATDRTGYEGDFFFLAQWFPKIGVWESRGTRGAGEAGWNCHPFHYYTEFFANFGHYKVALTVPKAFVVGASGLLIGETALGEEKTYTFAQKDIHDFAVVAAKDLVSEVRVFRPEEQVTDIEYQEAMTRLNLDKDQVRLKPVTMIFLYPKDQQLDVDRHFKALEVGLKHFGLWFGAYPYETITMVNPPTFAIGGMEYPTLITLGYRPHRPATKYSLESLILHEFAHQYFYGMLGSNEFEQAFMDEGFTSYASDKLTDMAYGKYGYFYPAFGYNWPLSDTLQLRRMTAVETYWPWRGSSAFEEPIALEGWKYYSRKNYGRNAYSKPALALNQLEKELGENTMAKVLRTYTTRFAFQHPSLNDFQAVAEEVSKRDLDWFFTRVFVQAGTVDYEALPVKTYDIRLNEGYTDGEQGPVLQDAEAEAETRKRQEVGVINHGDLVYPVTIAVTFEDGQVLTERWDGKGRWVRLYYDDAPPITKVVVDPDRLLVLDTRPANNSYVVDPNPQWQKSLSHTLVLGLQHILQTIALGF